MNEDRDFLHTEPIGVLLRKLAIPTVTAQVINMLYNMVDRIYIGHIPNIGPTALTGIGICLPLIVIISAFATPSNGGGAPRTSIALGRGDLVGAEEILGNCFSFQVIISVLTTILLLIFNEPLLMLFGASENTIEYATGYMDIYALGTIFVQLTLGMNAFITAQGFTKVSMKSVLIGAIMNIILDPIFIFALHMGVRGAAVATILSQLCSCIWVLRFLLSDKSLIRIKKENLRIKKDIIVPCITLGLGMFIMTVSESAVFVCYNASLQKYGGDIAVGAMTIIMSITQLVMLPIQGVGQGAQPIISYNYGARDGGRVRQAFKLLLKVNLGYTLVMWAFVMLWPYVFTSIFTPNADLINYTSKAMRIYFAAIGVFGIQVACQTTFGALGNAKASIIVACMRKFVLMIPLIYILPALLPGSKTIAVYLAEPISDALAVAFTIVLFYFQFKKSMTVLQQDQSENL